ncbi:MAG: hypothetical protein JW918_09320 [Anaerolineae bacterium]|nr:hypothetical protein [Anaerolineae bacterium]
MSGIGTLNEKPLHAALKERYAQPGDQFEVPVDDFFVDIVRDDLLIEIQTGNFASIKRKVRALVGSHSLRLVYPIAREKWIVRLAKDGSGDVLGRRKSPKHGGLEHIFGELVSFPKLLAAANFSVEVLLIQEEEIRRFDGRRGWRRRGWVTHERRLLDVVGRRLFETPEDLLALLPDLPEPWTTADLAIGIGQPRWLARKMAYCLRKMGLVEPVGKQGNAILYCEPDRQTDLRP